MNSVLAKYCQGMTAADKLRITKIWERHAAKFREKDGERPYGGHLPVFARTALAFIQEMESAGTGRKVRSRISKSS